MTPKIYGKTKPKQIAIVNSCIYATFNYFRLVWHLSTCASIRQIEKIYKRCLRIALDDYQKKLNKNNGNKATKSCGH